ncbi:hypothetical protein GDO78_020689, partial [Eleutherodactylus coqui]
RLGLFREAENQFKSALVHQNMVDTFLYLGKVYARMDQPLTALSTYKQGLDWFPKEVTLLCAVARIHEVRVGKRYLWLCYIATNNQTHSMQSSAQMCLLSCHFMFLKKKWGGDGTFRLFIKQRCCP